MHMAFGCGARQARHDELGFHRVVGSCGAISITSRGSRSGSREFVEMQADLKPLTEEQWEEVQERRPRMAFESKKQPLSCSHPDWRTVEPEDIKDWATDVLVEAMMRKEDTVQRSLEC